MRDEEHAAAVPLVPTTLRRQARRTPALLLALLLAGCAAQPPVAGVEKIDRVLNLIQQRLGYMDDVARNKWNSGAPIVACEYAGTVGVPALFTRALFDELAALSPDAGAKQVIAHHGEEVVPVPFPAAAFERLFVREWSWMRPAMRCSPPCGARLARWRAPIFPRHRA